MARYRVCAAYTVYLRCEVEAEGREHARRLAEVAYAADLPTFHRALVPPALRERIVFDEHDYDLVDTPVDLLWGEEPAEEFDEVCLCGAEATGECQGCYGAVCAEHATCLDCAHQAAYPGDYAPVREVA